MIGSTRSTRRTLWIHPAVMALAAVLCAVIPGRDARADVPIVDEENVQFGLSGYLRNLAGVQHLPYDVGQLLDTNFVGLDSSVMRLQWRLNASDWFSLEVQNRLFWQLSSDPILLENQLGLGSSNPPRQTLDMATHIVDRDTHVFVHDLDRLALRFYLEDVDLTVGRQAITWGRANLFPVSDIWTTFSPFELDTSEKPGVDAIRALTSVDEGRIELDFVLAERGALREFTEDGVEDTAEDVSGGARMTAYLDFGDVSAALAKSYEELMILADVTWVLDTWSLRAEVNWPFWDFDDSDVQLPRATAGADWFLSDDWILVLEYHFNGHGELSPSDYLAVLQSQELARGEVYFAGQHYLGTALQWNTTALLDMSLAVVMNTVDPSAIVVPQAIYRLADAAEVILGAYVGVGADPSLVDGAGVPRLSPSLRSEFGTYGNLYFVQLAGYL